jgi:hypothetical protein
MQCTPPRRPRLARAAAVPLLALALVAGLPRPARADRRAYAETYEAVTAARGQLDVEAWHTYASGGEVTNGPPSSGNRTMIELEYGLTSWWDVALYNLIDAGTEDPGYGGFKVETRFRLARPSTLFVDPVLYLEYQHLLRGDARDKFEVKGILGKDLDRWNLAVNVAFELERLPDEYKPEAEYAFGVSREIGSPAFKVGAELFGKVEKEDSPSGASELKAFVFAGPALSWATGINSPLSGIWLTVGAGRGLTSVSEAYYARVIVGLQF